MTAPSLPPELSAHVLDSLLDAVAVSNRDGTVRYMNRAALELLGYSAEQVIGQPGERFFAGREVFFKGRSLLRLIRQGEAREIETVLLARSGEKIPVIFNGSLVYDDHGQVVAIVGVARDIRPTRQLADQAQARAAEAHVLRAVAETLNRTARLQDALERTLDTVMKLTHASAGWIMLLEKTGEMRLAAAQNLPPALESDSRRQLAWPNCSCHRKLLSGELTEAVNIVECQRLLQVQGDTRGLRFHATVPLRIGTQLLGMMNLAAAVERVFSEPELHVLTAVGDQLAVAVERARLFEAERQRAEELAGLHRIFQTVSGSMDIRESCRLLTQQVAQLIGAPMCVIMLYDPATDEMRAQSPAYGVNDEFLTQFRYTVSELRLNWNFSQQGPFRVNSAGEIPPPLRSFAAALNVKTVLSARMQVEDRIVGAIMLANKPAGFDDDDARLLSVAATQTAAAIENTRLYQSTLKYAQDRAILFHVSQLITALLDPDQVCQAVHRAAEQLMPSEAFVMTRLDKRGGKIELIYGIDHGKRVPRQRFPAHRGLSARVITAGEPILINDTEQMDNLGALYFGEPEFVRSVLAVPMRLGARIIGMLSVQSYTPGVYTLDDQINLSLLANQAAVALENARLFDEANKALDRERRLNQVAHILGSTLDLEKVLPNIVRLAAELVDADAGTLATLTPDKEDLEHAYDYNLPPELESRFAPKGQGLAWQIIETQQSVLLSDYSQHPQARPYWVKAGAHSMIGVPVVAGDRCLGALGLFIFESDRTFNARDLALIESVGRQAGMAMQNARLFSETRRRAEELAAALARQEELDRLKSEFIQNASHELRTPLSIIRGYAELLETGDLGELDDEQHETVSIIARRSRMMTGLMADLSALLEAETRTLHREKMDLGQTVRTMLADFQASADKAALTLHAQVPSDSVWVSGDPIHLERVLDNLLTNALKFTPAGGRIEVRLWQDAQAVVLEVADTGVGIPPEKLAHVFERFYQVDGSMSRRYGGSGLGLALVKEVVEAHGGQVSVESTVGQGSTFRVMLPGLQ